MNRRYEEVEGWLVEKLASITGIDVDLVEIDTPFASYQIDSTVAVALASELAEWLSVPLAPTFFWEYPNVAAVARALCRAEVS